MNDSIKEYASIRDAVTSFLNIEDFPFCDADGDFDASEYIHKLMENLSNDRQLVLDFYHDICDENEEWSGAYTDYGVFKLAGKEDIGLLESMVNSVFDSCMKLAGAITINGPEEISSPVLCYIARISKLLELETPKIVLNEEKRLLANHILAASKELKRTETMKELPANEDTDAGIPANRLRGLSEIKEDDDYDEEFHRFSGVLPQGDGS